MFPEHFIFYTLFILYHPTSILHLSNNPKILPLNSKVPGVMKKKKETYNQFWNSETSQGSQITEDKWACHYTPMEDFISWKPVNLRIESRVSPPLPQWSNEELASSLLKKDNEFLCSDDF